MTPVLMFYRPSYPSLRAQDIQVLHAAHALAKVGCSVTIFANRTLKKCGKEDVLKQFGLAPLPNLHFYLSPSKHLGTTGLWFRQAVLRWWYAHRGVVIVRDIFRLQSMLPLLSDRHRIIVEAHQLPSLNDHEHDQPTREVHRIEQQVLQSAWGLITNCGGVMELWKKHHRGDIPGVRKVIHNGTAPTRQRISEKHENVIRCLGSLRPEKGIKQLLPTLKRSPVKIELIGASKEETTSLGPLPETIKIMPPVPYTKVPDLLSTAKALLLPLRNNRFGRSLTSPLKLWDYLATDRPILAADLPSIREIADLTGRKLMYYSAENPQTLLSLMENEFPERTQPHLRSWSMRADEISQLIQS